MFVIVVVFHCKKKKRTRKMVSVLSLLTRISLAAISKLEFDKKLIESKY